jgi:hypothetical protein
VVQKIAVSDDCSVTPLDDNNDASPGGLASQPTLSRLHDALSTEHNRAFLRSFLLEGAARCLKVTNGGNRQSYVTLDIDSLPIEVDSHQPGAEYNGHYGATIFHPLIATAASALATLLSPSLACRPWRQGAAGQALVPVLTTHLTGRHE